MKLFVGWVFLLVEDIAYSMEKCEAPAKMAVENVNQFLKRYLDLGGVYTRTLLGKTYQNLPLICEKVTV